MASAARRRDIPSAEAGRQSPRLPVPRRRRRRTLRQHFSDGLEAAVKAELGPFTTTKPRTMLGLMVRELVLEAAHAKGDAIKLVFSFLDQAAQERTEPETDGANDNFQGNSEPVTQWDWSADGVWDSSRRGEKT